MLKLFIYCPLFPKYIAFLQKSSVTNPTTKIERLNIQQLFIHTNKQILQISQIIYFLNSPHYADTMTDNTDNFLSEDPIKILQLFPVRQQDSCQFTLQKFEKLYEDLCCTICRDILNNPVYLRCSHRFCKQCIEKYIRLQEKKSCPNCRGQLSTKRDLRSDYHLISLITYAFGKPEQFKAKLEAAQISLTQNLVFIKTKNSIECQLKRQRSQTHQSLLNANEKLPSKRKKNEVLSDNFNQRNSSRDHHHQQSSQIIFENASQTEEAKNKLSKKERNRKKTQVARVQKQIQRNKKFEVIVINSQDSNQQKKMIIDDSSQKNSQIEIQQQKTPLPPSPSLSSSMKQQNDNLEEQNECKISKQIQFYGEQNTKNAQKPFILQAKEKSQNNFKLNQTMKQQNNSYFFQQQKKPQKLQPQSDPRLNPRLNPQLLNKNLFFKFSQDKQKKKENEGVVIEQKQLQGKGIDQCLLEAKKVLEKQFGIFYMRKLIQQCDAKCLIILRLSKKCTHLTPALQQKYIKVSINVQVIDICRIVSSKLNLHQNFTAFSIKIYIKNIHQATFTQIKDSKMTILDMINANLLNYKGVHVYNDPFHFFSLPNSNSKLQTIYYSIEMNSHVQ